MAYAKKNSGWHGEKIRHSNAKRLGKAGGTYRGTGVGQAGKTRYGANVTVKDQGKHKYVATVKVKKRPDAKRKLPAGTYRGVAVVKHGDRKYNAVVKVKKKGNLHYQAVIEVKKGMPKVKVEKKRKTKQVTDSGYRCDNPFTIATESPQSCR